MKELQIALVGEDRSNEQEARRKNMIQILVLIFAKFNLKYLSFIDPTLHHTTPPAGFPTRKEKRKRRWEGKALHCTR